MLQLLLLATVALGQSASPTGSPTAYTSVFPHTVTLPNPAANGSIYSYVGYYTVTDTVPPSAPVITGNVSTLTITTHPLVSVTAANGSVVEETAEIVVKYTVLQNATLYPINQPSDLLKANGGAKVAVGGLLAVPLMVALW